MRYFMLCVCLALASALKQEKSTRQQNNNVLLHSQAPRPLEPIFIRSNIPSHLVIPSISAANSAGLNQAIPINSNLNIHSYSAESLSDLNFGNGFPSADLPNLNGGSAIITIPTQQFGSAADYNNIFNVDTSFAVEPEGVAIKEIESLNPIINSLSKQKNSNHFSIDEAKLVSKLEFSENKNFKVGTNNPAFVKGFNSFDISKANTIEHKSPTKTSYSIVQVPEVASIHKTGPLVPSDIPSISELIKIFDSKSISNVPKKTTYAVSETTTTQFEKSDKDVLSLIEERISPSVKAKQTNSVLLSIQSRTDDDTNTTLSESTTNNSTNLSLESRTTDNTSTTLGEGEAVTTEKELTTDSSLVTESINKTEYKDILEDSEIISIASSKNVDDNLDKISNTTEDAGHLNSRLSENTTVQPLAKPLSPLNITSDNNSSIDSTNEQLLNETVIVQPILVPKLNAADFSNANDILKETSEFKAITGSPEILANSSDITESAPVKQLSINDDSIPSSATNSNNTQEYVSIVSESDLENDTSSNTNVSLSSETTESQGLHSRISSVQIIDNFGNDIDSQTDSNSTELETTENNDVKNVDESLKPKPIHSCLPCSYKAYINNLNKTLINESASASVTEASEPQDLITTTTTSNILSRISNVESRFSDDVHTSQVENVTEILTDSNTRTESVTVTQILTDAVTGLSEIDTAFTSEVSTIEAEGTTISTDDLKEDHLAVYNSSISHILDAVKQANL